MICLGFINSLKNVALKALKIYTLLQG